MAVLVQTARAKINLTLRVLGRRADGYHELESLVVFADAGDRLMLDTDAPDGFSMSGPSAATVDGVNLVERVLSELRASTPHLHPGHFHLEKHLPVAAGIGGGSADAAAAIRLLEQRYPGHAAVAALAAGSSRLGADIPACLVSHALVMTGLGELLRPLTRVEPIPALIVNPHLPLATASVFKALAAAALAPDAAPLEWPDTLSLEEVIDLIADRPNDLEPVAVRMLPAIGHVLNALATLPGCRIARMTGSGPTCFGLFDDGESTRRGAMKLRSTQPGWWIASTTLS